mgnify:CR=1 FL=1
MLARLAFLLLVLFALPAAAGMTVRDVRLGQQEGGATRFVLELDGAADYRLFVLDNPRRAVIDLPTLIWPANLTPTGRGVVKGWRYGQFGSGTRVVLDLNDPIKVVGTQLIPPRDGKGVRLVVDLAASTQPEFAALVNTKFWGRRAAEGIPAIVAESHEAEAAERSQASIASLIDMQAAAQPPASLGQDVVFPKPPSLPSRRRMDLQPVVVVDAGHGGVDPGAIAVTGHHEKAITLSVARQLAKRLEASGYRVVMTRSRDVFVPLQGRVQIARRANADLFISLHADSVRNRAIRGATVYTLSDRATDREAAELAESENRADTLAGLPAAGRDNQLADILTAMSYRASVNGGRDLSALVVRQLRERGIALTDNPQRSAGFAVLKAPDIPSVLVEMGYLTSRNDANLLVQAQHQAKIVGAISDAVDSYFNRHRPSAEALAALTGRNE